MNEEDRLLVELAYGIDMSYRTEGEFENRVLKKLPSIFLLRRILKHGGTGLHKREVCLTDEFRAAFVNDLIEYKNKQ